MFYKFAAESILITMKKIISFLAVVLLGLCVCGTVTSCGDKKTGSSSSSKSETKSKEYYEEEIMKLSKEYNRAIEEGDFDKARRIEEKALKLLTEYDELLKKENDGKGLDLYSGSDFLYDDDEEVVEDWDYYEDDVPPQIIEEYETFEIPQLEENE